MLSPSIVPQTKRTTSPVQPWCELGERYWSKEASQPSPTVDLLLVLRALGFRWLLKPVVLTREMQEVFVIVGVLLGA